MSFDGIWEGTLDGTNWGRAILKIVEDSSAVSGNAQIDDVGVGTYSMDMKGEIVGDEIRMFLSTAPNSIHEYPGSITGHGKLTDSNQLAGEWKSTIGTYGNFLVERRASLVYDPSKVEAAIEEANKAFIMMAFGHSEPGSLHNRDVVAAIQRACAAVSIDAYRADEIEHSGSITKVIVDSIKKHRFLIGDLTHVRPNVYYEVGYAHGIKKEVILTAYKGTSIQFDIASYNVIFYESATGLEEKLIKRLKSKLTDKEREKFS